MRDIAVIDSRLITFYGTLSVEENGKSIRYREWLTDVVWYYRTQGPPKIESILLALESEWGKATEVEYDFCKLLAVKAPIKIMLFESDTLPTLLEKLNALGKAWTQHTDGDVIYAINFCAGKHQTWFYRKQHSGSDSKFELAQDADLSGEHSKV